MKVSLHWLKDHIDISLPPKSLSRLLTAKSFEVEEEYQPGEGIEGVIVGEIKEITKHPDADRLHITKIDVKQKELLNIVCGGTNIKVGQKVPVATIGAVLPGEFKIKRTKIRGIESEGMLCSSQELGFMSEGKGSIMILGEEAKVGVDIHKVLDLGDWIFEYSVPANRGDIQSHKGVAREIAALNEKRWKEKQMKLPKPKKNKQLLGNISIEIKDKELCPYMACLIIDNIKIKPSPQWLQNRLRNIGIRPINNIVDITNYVMHDLGQPLHAFDYHKIQGQKMIVRGAQEGEVMQTLDNREQKLQKDMMIIEDSERIIDLAGIMGGKNSEVDEKTTTICLQGAVFNGPNTQKTSRALGQRTEAVAYFEKGVDGTQTNSALAGAFELMKEIDNSVELIHVVQQGRQNLELKKIDFNPQEVKKSIGIDIPEKEIKSILENLYFEVKKNSDNSWIITIPSFRLDIEGQHDLVEEIVRIYGLENITSTLPTLSLTKSSPNPYEKHGKKIKSILNNNGLYEVCNYSFIGKKDIDIQPNQKINEYIEVSNPISDSMQYMRHDLVSGILKNVITNYKYRDSVKVFELGKVYFPDKQDVVREYWTLEGTIAHKNAEIEQVFLEVKEVLNEVFGIFYTQSVQYKKDEKNTGNAIIWSPRGEEIGVIDIVEESRLKALKVDGVAVYFQIDMENLYKETSEIKEFSYLPEYPPVKLDITFAVNKKYTIQEIENFIKNTNTEYLESVELFDKFVDEKLKNKQSLSYHCIYRKEKDTLVGEEVDTVHKGLIKKLEKKFKITIR